MTGAMSYDTFFCSLISLYGFPILRICYDLHWYSKLPYATMRTLRLCALFVACFLRIHTNRDLYSLNSLQYSILRFMPPPFLCLHIYLN